MRQGKGKQLNDFHVNSLIVQSRKFTRWMMSYTILPPLHLRLLKHHIHIVPSRLPINLMELALVESAVMMLPQLFEWTGKICFFGQLLPKLLRSLVLECHLLKSTALSRAWTQFSLQAWPPRSSEHGLTTLDPSWCGNLLSCSMLGIIQVEKLLGKTFLQTTLKLCRTLLITFANFVLPVSHWMFLTVVGSSSVNFIMPFLRSLK